ncbi:MAG: RNA-guided endonuclease InsQ/TnpB family protein [Candidatus Thorarchaeota archaeon]|jgi:putative transposase
MRVARAWKYRLYPSKLQKQELDRYLSECKNLWNKLLEFVKRCYEETGIFPTRSQLHLLTKESAIFSQVAQNVDERLLKSLKGTVSRKKAGRKAGFPRFKSIDRMKSFTYPQFGFKLDEKLHLSGIGDIAIKKHRDLEGIIKTLTIKKSPGGRWYAIFTSEVEIKPPKRKEQREVGIDLGIEHFAHLSDNSIIENPRHLKKAEEGLKNRHKSLSKKKKGSGNRRKARLRLGHAFERLTDARRDFLHKLSRKLVEKYSLLALENLNVADMARGFNRVRRNEHGTQGTSVPCRLAKHVLDCGWAEFLSMLTYKAEGAGCEVMLVDAAHTTQECSNCGKIHKKTLSERWHDCPCGASMHRDLNAAINILARATGGTLGSQACLRRDLCMQASSMKQEAHTFRCG